MVTIRHLSTRMAGGTFRGTFRDTFRDTFRGGVSLRETSGYLWASTKALLVTPS